MATLASTSANPLLDGPALQSRIEMSVRSAPEKSARRRSAPANIAPPRSAFRRLAFRRSALEKSALRRSARSKFVPHETAPTNFPSLRSAREPRRPSDSSQIQQLICVVRTVDGVDMESSSLPHGTTPPEGRHRNIDLSEATPYLALYRDPLCAAAIEVEVDRMTVQPIKQRQRSPSFQHERRVLHLESNLSHDAFVECLFRGQPNTTVGSHASWSSFSSGVSWFRSGLRYSSTKCSTCSGAKSHWLMLWTGTCLGNSAHQHP